MGLTVLCPSRGRPDAAWALFDSVEKTRQNASTRLVFVLDHDDETRPEYERLRDGRQLTVISPEHGGGMVAALNAAALATIRDWPHDDVLGFVGDDHRFRSKGWDERFHEALKDRPGFVYGNDKFWPKGEIPTQIFISTPIVKGLGWMGLPTCNHLYIDNVWKELGEATGTIRYYPDVVIEHMHPAGGKAEWDEGYRRVNSETMYNHDAAAFAEWRESPQFMVDVNKVGRSLASHK